jgi:AcrR family transcriptional regulator
MREADPLVTSVWMRPPRRRGGQPALSREQIVRAAVELLDADGLAGLSMRRLGTRLGAGATSAYWYVANKDELLELATDEVMGEVRVPDAAEVGWREACGACARGVRAMILAHPWLARLLGTRPNFGPTARRMSDRVVEALTTAGFAGAEVAYASSLILGHALGIASTEAAWRGVMAQAGKTDAQIVAELAPVIERAAADYPHYRAWWDANKSMDMAKLQEESFSFGVERLLDGLSAWLAVRAS